MATNFPTSVDNFTNPTANDSLNLPSHSTQHANANDAIEAVEDYLLNGAGRSGLVLVKTQTIGTGVSSVSVTDAFSATYDNYKIMISNCVGSTNANILLTLTGSTASYASSVIYLPYAGGSPAGASLGTTSWSEAGSITANGVSMNAELNDPFLARTTGFRSLHTTMTSNGSAIVINGMHNVASSFSGFTIATTTGTITGGTIAVYGYRK